MTIALVRLLAIVLHLAAPEISSEPVELLWMSGGLPQAEWQVSRTSPNAVSIRDSQQHLVAELASELDLTWIVAELGDEGSNDRRPIGLGAVSLSSAAPALTAADTVASLTLDASLVIASWDSFARDPRAHDAMDSVEGMDGGEAMDSGSAMDSAESVQSGEASLARATASEAGEISIRRGRSTISVADRSSGDTLVLALEAR